MHNGKYGGVENSAPDFRDDLPMSRISPDGQKSEMGSAYDL
jgi:hypothetical protein